MPSACCRLDIVTQCPGLKRCLAALLVRGQGGNTSRFAMWLGCLSASIAMHILPYRLLLSLPALPCFLPLQVREAVAAAGMPGKDFETRSVLGPLLAVSTLPSYGLDLRRLNFPAKPCFQQLRCGRWRAGLRAASAARFRCFFGQDGMLCFADSSPCRPYACLPAACHGPFYSPCPFTSAAWFAPRRNYPRNRGAQVESEYASIRRSLARVYTGGPAQGLRCVFGCSACMCGHPLWEWTRRGVLRLCHS